MARSPKRSAYAAAAETWFKRHHTHTATSKELWAGLAKSHPELTTSTEKRKTPRSTCMRDLRKDAAFDVNKGTITYTNKE